MSDDLEKKSEKRPKTLNEFYEKMRNQEIEEGIRPPSLYEHFLAITPNPRIYQKNSQISFTP